MLRRLTRLVPPSVVLASVLLFLASLMWSALTPGFQTPDELQHTNSVIRIAEGGGWPAPGDPLVEDETLEARHLAGAVRDGRHMAFPRGTDPIPPEAPYFANVTPTGVDDRLSFRELDDGPVTEGPIDQMTQHPPGYYGVAAVVYDVLGAGDWRYDRAMFLIRALTALMVAVTVPISCYVAGRELTGRSSVGQIAAFVPLLVPQLAYISGAVTNDGAAIATTAVMWAAMFRVTCSGPTRKRLIFLAVAVAAACWTKGTAVALLPTVPLAIAVAYHRHVGGAFRTWARPALLAIIGTSGLAFVLGGWWWGLNLLRYGRIQPAAYEIPPNGPIELLSLPDYALMFVARMRWTFFLEVGVREHYSLRLLTLVLTLVFVVLIAVGFASRRHLGDRLVMLLGAGATIGVLFGTTYSAHLQSNRLPGIQGRYLFVLLVPIVALVAIGLIRIAERIRVSEAWLLRGTALSGFCVTALALFLGFRIFYTVPGRSFGEGVDRFLLWVPWSPAVLWAMAGAYAAAGLLLAWVLARRRSIEASDTGSPTVPGATSDSDGGSSVAPGGRKKEFQVTQTP